MGGVSCFSTQDMVIKFLSGAYPLHEIILVRATIAIMFTLVVFVPLEGGLRKLYTYCGASLLCLPICFFLQAWPRFHSEKQRLPFSLHHY